MGVRPHHLIRTTLLLALLTCASAAHAEPGTEDLLELGDTHLLADAFESAAKTYGKIGLSPGILALPLLAQAETYERWGRLGKAARTYGRFVDHSRSLLPAAAAERLLGRRAWLAWNHATFRSRRLLGSAVTLLVGGVALGGLGALSYLGGRNLIADAELDMNAIIGGIVLTGLGVVGFSIGGIFGLTGLINLLRAGAMRSMHPEEPPRPAPLPEPPAWRTLLAPPTSTSTPAALSTPPLVRVPPPPIEILPR